MFVQPVGELLGPSDLSLALSLVNLSPITQAITFMDIVCCVKCIRKKENVLFFVEATLICRGHKLVKEVLM